MILLSCIASLLTGDKSRGPAARRSRRAAAVAGLASTLFLKPVGVAGTLGRVALLMIAAGFSYFVGTGLAQLMMKAPLPVALMFGAALAVLASSDPDRS